MHTHIHHCTSMFTTCIAKARQYRHLLDKQDSLRMQLDSVEHIRTQLAEELEFHQRIAYNPAQEMQALEDRIKRTEQYTDQREIIRLKLRERIAQQLSVLGELYQTHQHWHEEQAAHILELRNILDQAQETLTLAQKSQKTSRLKGGSYRTKVGSENLKTLAEHIHLHTAQASLTQAERECAQATSALVQARREYRQLQDKHRQEENTLEQEVAALTLELTRMDSEIQDAQAAQRLGEEQLASAYAIDQNPQLSIDLCERISANLMRRTELERSFENLSERRDICAHELRTSTLGRLLLRCVELLHARMRSHTRSQSQTADRKA